MARIIGVFTDPKATFADIGRRPTWLVPVILIAVVNLIVAAGIGQRSGWERIVRQQLEKNSSQNVSAEQMQRQIEMGTKVASVMGYVGPVAGAFVGVVVVAAILMGTVNIFGGNVTFKQSLGVTAHASLVGIIAAVLTLVVLYAKPPDEFDINNPLAFNLAAFLGEGTSKVMVALAKSFDLFSFATMWMLAVGYAAVSGKMTFGKALAAVGLPWAVFVVCRVGWAAIF